MDIGKLALQFGDGAGGIIDLLFETGIFDLELGQRGAGGGTGQAGGEGLAFGGDQFARGGGVLRVGRELQIAVEVIDGADRLRELFRVKDAEFVMGLGKLGIGGEGGFVLAGRGAGVAVIEVLLRLLVMWIARVVLAGLREGRQAGDTGACGEQQEAQATRHESKTNKRAFSCKINGPARDGGPDGRTHLCCRSAPIPGKMAGMKSIPFLQPAAVLLGIMLMAGAARAQSSGTPSAPTSGTVGDAFQVARGAVKPELQTKVVSVYGTGAPAAIDKWYIIFYDPGVPSHGRAVLVQDQKIAKAYPANGGIVYSKDLTFDPSRITSERPALSAAQTYATRHKIAYDSVHALLKQTAANKPFRWRVELLHEGRSRGFVYVNALDDSVAAYTSPAAAKKQTSGSSESDEGFANDVKNTFLGIGADLEEFFTGDRTVDK